MTSTRRTAFATLALLVTGVVGTQLRGPVPTVIDEARAARADAPGDGQHAISALGRLEPKNGVICISGPSKLSVVVAELLVDEGATVRRGDPLAILDDHATLQADVARLEAEVRHAQNELERHEALHRDGIDAVSIRDSWRLQAEVARASLARARAELERSTVRAPIDGQVLEIFARAGEKVEPDGIAELGQTQEMYAVAEVYETDIGRVALGQAATITSAALREPMQGIVERIRPKVGKQDVLDTDPTARTDARVVEVEIRLQDAGRAAGLTNLQVDVAINP
jgi:HlyD family secretion protein